VPAPTVDQGKARNAVMSVVRVLATEREDWAGWENAFEGYDEEDLNRIVGVMDLRHVDEEIRSLWEERVGRPWKDGEDGERVAVELE